TSVALAEETSGGNTKYATDFDSMDDAIEAAEQMTEDTAAEGDTLLKNRNNALPMKGNEYVSVLGVSADELIGAAATSGQSTASAGGDTVADILSDAGFRVNPTLQNYYASQSATIGQEDTTFNSKVKSSFNLYNDAAVIVISRTGGEGSDCSRNTGEAAGTSLTGEKDEDSHVALASNGSTSYKHYLMLTDSERELIKMAGNTFDKVIVVLNTSNAMEIEELRDNDNVDAVINIDRPGQGGLAALAKILNGEVNPSGGLVDEWYTDFTADPTWYNFGDNSQTSSTGAGSNTYMSSIGSTSGTTSDGSDVIGDTEGFHGVDYEESIYLGYKYYETYYYDMYNAGYEDEAQQWWEDNVTYAFGYGLSYTTFSFKSNGIYTDADCTTKLSSGDVSSLFKSTASKAAEVETIYLPVTVTNTGDVAGKKTVQVYVSAPYDDTSVVEKASVSLVGYAKTDELKPGQSQTVVVSVNVQDMASWYSYYAQSDNSTSGAYIMEKGDYTLRIMEDSHYDCRTQYDSNGDYYYIEENGAKIEECYAEETFTLSSNIALEQDDYSGNQVSSLFTDGLNDNGDGMTSSSKVTDSNFGNIRMAAMMADGTSGMTSMTRNSKVSSTNTSVAAMNDSSVTSTSVVNYSGVGVPTNNTSSNGSKAVVNGFDLSFPVAPTTKDLTFNDNVLDNWSYWDNYAVSSTYSGASDATSNYSSYYEIDDDAGYVWSKTSSDIPSTWTQAKGVLGQYENAGANGDKGSQMIWFYSSQTDTSKITLTFADMEGVDYDNPLWDTFLNQLTYDELCQVNTYCGYGTVNIDSVGKSVTVDRDGPNSINQEFQCCSESLLAAMWNVEIAERRGVIIGNIALLGGFEGWYAPGADTHRSPFSGRNNEYFSQDGILGGYMGAALTQGVQSKGVICYCKHILMNDQETDRGCLFTWCDEQAMRENYIKTFQMILQEGECKAGMTAYGRIAGKSNTNNTNLSVELYQEEWGSHAYFVTDGYIGWNQRTNPDIMVRAGAQTMLTTANTEYLSGQTDPDTGESTTGGWYAAGETLPDGTTASVQGVYLAQDDGNGGTCYKICYTQWYCVREMAHNVLYQVANSAGQFNGYSTLSITGGTLSATEGLSADLSVSISSLIDEDSCVTYSLASSLPAGLSFDTLTGAISGTPTETGTYALTVNYTIDGWITKSATYTLTVDAAIYATSESDSFTELEVGTEFYAELTSDVYTSAEYNSITYSISDGALPDGLTLNEDGTITGTPTAAGTYTFTVTLTADNVDETSTASASLAAAQLTSGWDKGGSGSTEKTIETTFTIVVAGDTADEPSTELTIDDVNTKVEDLTASIDSLTSDIEELQSYIDELETAVNNLASGDSSSSTTEDSGCSGNIVANVATVAAMCGIFAAAVVVLRKKRNNNKED
ncbi:MAG: glycoside hydrolase family 3 C-terminal domain-containing protein, partial [Clostridia bacterium]|nr:glycoside hydrolase family 3 C-terminal domain-containing protein [Clostridia bacterium]